MTFDDKIEKLESKPGASQVFLGDDGFLKIIIDLNIKDDMFVETRVGAFGTLEWAKELVSRFIMAKEMKYAKDKALAKGIVVPKMEVRRPN